MQAKLATYRREGALALRHMLYVILVFSLVQFIVSVIVANANSVDLGGYRSIAFSAIWALLLVLIFAYLGGIIVFRGKTSELMVGFLIGVAATLSELFFVLAVIFFGIGVEASNNGWNTAPSDKAYGAFALINTIIYAVWAIILSVHRRAVTISAQPTDSTQQQYETNNVGDVYNPSASNPKVSDEEAEL